MILPLKSGFNNLRTLRSINNLVDKNLIKKLDKGPSTVEQHPIY